MTSISIDTSELRAFAAALDGAPNLLQSKVVGVVKKGAGNIKEQQQAEARASTHFKGFASAISYDVREGGAFGGGFVEAEIGPTKGKPGSLANIAYFGTSRGGGTVADPANALNDEAPRFEKALGDLMEGLLK